MVAGALASLEAGALAAGTLAPGGATEAPSDGAGELEAPHALATRMTATPSADVLHGTRIDLIDRLLFSPVGRRRPRTSTPVARVQGVSQGVPQEIEREDRGHDGQARQGHDARVGPVVADV